MKLDSKLYKPLEKEEGRDKDREKRRSYRVRLGALKGSLVKEEEGVTHLSNLRNKLGRESFVHHKVLME